MTGFLVFLGVPQGAVDLFLTYRVISTSTNIVSIYIAYFITYLITKSIELAYDRGAFTIR